jgi:Fur family ferric uptake transcriptional regulator/Fur family zinc uptake transcriptional regulator
MDRVTLYRTLASLVKKCVAHQVQGPDGAWRFCSHRPTDNGCPGNHPHFLCESCGTMICLTDQSLTRVEVPDGYAIAGKQFVVYGKCSGCADISKKKLRKKPRKNLKKHPLLCIL